VANNPVPSASALVGMIAMPYALRGIRRAWNNRSNGRGWFEGEPTWGMLPTQVTDPNDNSAILRTSRAYKNAPANLRLDGTVRDHYNGLERIDARSEVDIAEARANIHKTRMNPRRKGDVARTVVDSALEKAAGRNNYDPLQRIEATNLRGVTAYRNRQFRDAERHYGNALQTAVRELEEIYTSNNGGQTQTGSPVTAAPNPGATQDFADEYLNTIRTLRENIVRSGIGRATVARNIAGDRVGARTIADEIINTHYTQPGQPARTIVGRGRNAREAPLLEPTGELYDMLNAIRT